MKHLLFRILFVAVLPGAAWSQEPRFTQHDLGDAYSGITILAMIQDHNCMIWLGTENGLARYDGINWHPIELPLDTVKSIRVTALAEDSKHRIWVGTSTGRIFFLDAARRVHRFTIEEGHPGKEITAILEDGMGQMWFATYGEGAYVYTDRRMYSFDMDDGLSGEDIYDMALSGNDEVWLGTDNGISICTFSDEAKHIRTLGLKDGLPDQIITALEPDEAGGMYIGTFEFGIVYFDPVRKLIRSPFPNPVTGEVTAIDIFDGREIWYGTRSDGIWRYVPEWKEPRKLERLNGIRTTAVTEIASDVEGNIWVAMVGKGLISAYRPFEVLVSNVGDIQTLASDHRNRLWIGTKKGLYVVDHDANGHDAPVQVASQYDLNITDIAEDQYHQLWIGTLDKGLFIYDPSRNDMLHVGSIFEKGGITIMSIAQTRDAIWIATLEGVVSYPADKNIAADRLRQFRLLEDPWQSNLHFVFQVYVDSKDRIWFATDGKGVFCIDQDQVKHYPGNDSIALRNVYSICEDHRGHMWFNTPDFGLVEFDGTSYKPLGFEEGLSNLNMASIMSTGTGDLLIAHNRGIDVMEPDRRHFMYFGEEIGAKEIEAGLNAVTVDKDQNVYVGCRNMIFKYFSTHHDLSIHPRTQITTVSVFEAPVDFAHKNRFMHAENYFTFDYVGLWYTSPASVKYLYRLEGYDLQWKESKDNVASYSHLRPGTYTFSVKASENNFFLDEPITSYTFTIDKPFWLHYWFIGLVTLSSVGMMRWLVKSREKRSERQALLKKEMVESQLSALKAQINPHFLFNSFNTLITIIDENATKPGIAIEYVEKLSDFYRSILQYREQESITLEEEFQLVRNFAYLLEKRYGHYLRLHIGEPAGEALILPLTLQILVENAVKHNVISEQHPLDVFISCDEDGYVTVKNNLQPKAKPEPSTQFGLQSIVKQYQLLSDDKVIIHKGPDTFTVRIPIIKRSLT